MKKLVLLSAVSILALTSADAFAAKAEFTGGRATAEIVTAIEINETHQMDFGKLSNKAGTAVLGTDNTLTSDNKIGNAETFAGAFDITGPENTSITVGVEGNQITLNGAGTPMIVNKLQFDLDGSKINKGAIVGGGTSKLKIGGTLTIGEKQAAGTYTGSYTVTVDY